MGRCVLALCCVLALRCVLALCCVLALYCVVSVVFLVLFLAWCCFSRHFQAYYTGLQCVRSAALVAKVYPLAFFFPALGRGLVAGLWILLATGGGSILQGLGCSPSVELSLGT